ncbi:hypothetical protein Raf01_29510 [Rugosimonospora africana]|uniref:NIF system FeS cluster assembly NifU C-terminal domain-containing protein n=2 Tax=Rugosimonospora africana TaxID=556532 RepID=A0A8J3QQN9_9ACTN|nr:hypothetical protein Raf01_29510 [Rugosimonospora africana]
MSVNGQRELERVRTVEERLERVEALPEPARGTAVALVQALLALYGDGLDRMASAGRRTGGEAFAADLVGDDLVAHLLLLHGLHPQEAPERIGRAIDRLGSRLHGARARLVEVTGGVARLRVGNVSGCGSSRAAVEEVLTEAVRAAAPEVTGVEVEYEQRQPALIPLDSLRRHATVAARPVRTEPEQV